MEKGVGEGGDRRAVAWGVGERGSGEAGGVVDGMGGDGVEESKGTAGDGLSRAGKAEGAAEVCKDWQPASRQTKSAQPAA